MVMYGTYKWLGDFYVLSRYWRKWNKQFKGARSTRRWLSLLSSQSLGDSHVPHFIRRLAPGTNCICHLHTTDVTDLHWMPILWGCHSAWIWTWSVHVMFGMSENAWNRKLWILNIPMLGSCNKIGFAAFASCATGGAAQSWLRADIALWGTPRACTGAEPGAHFTRGIVYLHIHTWYRNDPHTYCILYTVLSFFCTPKNTVGALLSVSASVYHPLSMVGLSPALPICRM